MSSVIAIIQARMGSSRLPGKMMLPLAGKPIIDYVLMRLSTALRPQGMLDSLVLATSTEKNNDPLVDHVAVHWPQVKIIRGAEDDVLSRFKTAIDETGADIIVRATGDCPFVNIDAMHNMLTELLNSGADIVNYQPGYEYVDKGLEVVRADALLRALNDPEPTSMDREHVTSLLYKHPDRYKVQYVQSAPELRRGDIRLTIDTPADLEFFETLFQELQEENIATISPQDIVEVLNRKPELKSINASSGRKSTRHERARLGFRCDGGTEIGLGHVVGSIRLARLLSKELGLGVEFVVRENQATQNLIHEAGFAMEVLPKQISPEDDIGRLVEKKLESDLSGVVINFCKEDLERYTTYFQAIKESGLKLIFMDNPLPPSWEMGDLLINALPHPEYNGYDPNRHPACLDGLEYFIPGFEGSPPERVIRSSVQRVLIAMGGADKPNLTEMVVKALAETNFKGYVDVVLGSACFHFESVQKSLKASGLNGDVSQNVSDLYRRMCLADLAFSGLGLTTYEMAYTGLPVCIISSSELNAKAAEQYVQNYRAAEHIGFYRNVDQNLISSRFSKLMNGQGKRLNLSSVEYRVGKKVDQVVFSVSSVLNLFKPGNSKQEMTN
ncbi:cytidylyltransferase domain-containing protein [Desulfohalobium retbaense]|uniref:Acylneuraminate cytidylyltransferase n=1 Tax=Desulfohalobium retbaense (strain ATCC 49708 / DSM 5692 / JCM 16813 / HR100) TaxID=485915 RepID=C8WYZ7_DESRD|nr:NTP transferase domain-containing protein [Desulfohalobium retbaense]ACV67913.1 acylneuraminate cytidylyltransferase [Desulfohalobium retbaense DSM 5692]